MSWEYYLAAAGGLFMLGCFGLFALIAIAAMLSRGAGARVSDAVSSVATAVSAPLRPSLSSAMEHIDVQARAAAYDSVSDKIKAHRAGRYEAELMDALAPKPSAGTPSPPA